MCGCVSLCVREQDLVISPLHVLCGLPIHDTSFSSELSQHMQLCGSVSQQKCSICLVFRMLSLATCEQWTSVKLLTHSERPPARDFEERLHYSSQACLKLEPLLTELC